MIATPPAKIAGTEESGSAFLKKKKERDGASADTNAREQRIIESGSAEFLVPPSREPEDRQVNQDRQCGARFDDETAGTFTNAIGSKTREDLMRAVKYGSNDCVPKPGFHEILLHHEMDHSRED